MTMKGIRSEIMSTDRPSWFLLTTVYKYYLLVNISSNLIPLSDIDQTPQDKLNKELERRKRRALHSSIMKELEAEYSGAPEEIKANYDSFITFSHLI